MRGEQSRVKRGNVKMEDGGVHRISELPAPKERQRRGLIRVGRRHRWTWGIPPCFACEGLEQSSADTTPLIVGGDVQRQHDVGRVFVINADVAAGHDCCRRVGSDDDQGLVESLRPVLGLLRRVVAARPGIFTQSSVRSCLTACRSPALYGRMWQRITSSSSCMLATL